MMIDLADFNPDDLAMCEIEVEYLTYTKCTWRTPTTTMDLNRSDVHALTRAVSPRQKECILLNAKTTDDVRVLRDKAKEVLGEWEDEVRKRNIPEWDEPVDIKTLLDTCYWKGPNKVLEAAIITMCNIPDREPIWLALVAPASCGKTLLTMMMDVGPGYAFHITEMTDNALAPSGTSKSDNDREAMLSYLDQITLLIDDLTAMLGNDQKSREFLSRTVNAYGITYSKMGPSGMQSYNSEWNWLFGMTRDLLYANYKVMNLLAARNLVVSWNADDVKNTNTKIKKSTWLEYGEYNWKRKLVRFINDTRARIPETKMSNTLMLQLDSFSKQLAYLRSWKRIEPEGHDRVKNQGVNFCKTRATMYNRDVVDDDIVKFVDVVRETIPYYNVLEYVRDHSGCTTKDVRNKFNWKEDRTIGILNGMRYKGIIECNVEKSGTKNSPVVTYTWSVVASKCDVLGPEQVLKLKPSDMKKKRGYEHD